MSTTRSNTLIWPWNESLVSDIAELGSRPPTRKTVFLHFMHHHTILQNQQHGKATADDAADIAAEAVMKWWQRYQNEITLKSKMQIIRKILKENKDWKCRKKYFNRFSHKESSAKKVGEYQHDMKKTFWVAAANQSNLDDTDKRFLENM